MTAAYPNTIRTFTPKTDGVDTVLAAHVNLLQDEVRAMQVELGTDPKGPNQRSRTYTDVAALLEDLESRKYEAGDTLKAGSGSVANPSLGFNSQTMGFYREDGGLSLSIDGVRSAQWLRGSDGDGAFDSFSGGERNEEIRFYHSSDDIRFLTSDVVRMTITNQGVTTNQWFNATGGLRSAGVEVVTNTQRFRGLTAAGAGNPAYAFTGQANTGMYHKATSEIGFATNGGLRAYVTNDGLTVNANYLRGGSGTGTSNNNTLQPGLGFYQHLNVGFDSASNSQMNAIVGGHSTMTFYGDRTWSQYPLELSDHGKALRFNGDVNTGIERRTAGSGGMSFVSNNQVVALVAGDATSFSPGANGTIDLGTNGLRWEQLFASTSTISTSDARDKTDIIESDLGLEWVLNITPRRYRKKKGVRPHYGFVAQEVKQVMDDLGVFDFAGFIDATKDETNLDAPEGHVPLMGLRYEEFVAPAYKAIQDLHGIVEEDRDLIDTLVARIEALEGAADA